MFNLFGSLMKSGPKLDAAEVVRQVSAGTALLIDVREEAECRGGKAKGALNLPLSRLHLCCDPKSGHFDKRLSQAQKAGHPIYLYCASGARSGRAAQVMRGNGFEDVHNLGNLGAWQSGGGAVVR
ncbi:rhodanese-like domain-containing protein [Pararhodobacter sp.]|uniref:rhodanese-like domain-containing protein n=1 Tax=Pararhodobacter sp. TaxID=2127056 RepID=UPI002AFF759C|nr:rhodanese-like domain-containing protein [Pararhodobacter sp.]